MSVLAVSGIGGALAWTKAGRVPRHLRANLGFWEALTYKEEKRREPPALTPEQRREMRARIDGAIADFEKDFPILDTVERPVPDDVNGYRLIHELMDPTGDPRTFVGQELADLLGEKAAWDAVKMKTLLAEHAELVGKIGRIASLPTRSSTHMPDNYFGFISARAGKFSAEILLAKARLAAEAGDEKEALHQVAAALNFSRHYVEVEEPTLLGETVAILIEQQIQKAALTQLLPALGRSADLAAWKQVLTPREINGAHWAALMRGEWHNSCRYMLMPFLLDGRRKDNPPDAEEFLRFYTEHWAKLIGSYGGMSPAELLKAGGPDMAGYSSLSEESRQYADLAFIGAGSWTHGYVRHAKINAQYQAAMELLITEKSGGTLASTSVEKVTRNPLDGAAFSYDPATRTLSSPPAWEKDGEVKIVLPF